jgi:membrane protein
MVNASASEAGDAVNGGPPAHARAPAPRRWIAHLRRALAIMARAAQAIRAERVQTRAMALTFISLFALVPALVVAFSVIQGFTGMDRIGALVHDYLLENLAVGARASIEPYLDRFVRNAHVARAGLVGAALLLWSAYSLLGSVEAAVNDLWEVRVRRAFRVRALVYWMTLTLGPLLIAASATVSELARSYLVDRELRFLAVIAAGALSATFLTALYFVVPNVRVRFGAALSGGVAAGIGWELAKWGFAWVMGKSVRVHAIYGSVAAIPIFLTWLYVSWSIFLFGARLGFVVQHARHVMAGGDGPISRGALELLAARALVHVSEAFRAGAPAPRPDEVARKLRAGVGGIEVVETLRKAALLSTLGNGGLVPGRAPEGITLLDARNAIRSEPPAHAGGALGEAFQEAERRAEERLRAVSIASLCAPVVADASLSDPVSDPSGVGNRPPGPGPA